MPDISKIKLLDGTICDIKDANAIKTSKAAESDGTALSLVTTGEKAIWNAKTSNVGTITGIKMNGVSKGTSGIVDLGSVITAHQDISGKLNANTKGMANGVAELDANGKVPVTQLPIDKSLTVEGAAADAKAVGDLKSQMYSEIAGDPNDFINGFVYTNTNNKGHVNTGTTLTIVTKGFIGSRDVLKVKALDGYSFMAYVYSLTEGILLGYINSYGVVGNGEVKFFTTFNLKDYSPNYIFRFGVIKKESDVRVDIAPEDAVNVLFVRENNNFLSGYKLSVMGDSISTFTGYTTPGAPDAYYPLKSSFVEYVQNMYWKILSQNTGLTIDTIDAYGGSTVGTKWTDAARVDFIDESRLSRLGTPDVIIVEGGINDFGGNPLGEYPVDGSYTNLYEFRTAYAYLIDQLKQRYTGAKIVCLSMITPRSYNNSVFPEKQTEVKQALASDKTTHYFYEFNVAISEICKRYECVFCDITDIMNYYLNPTSSLGAHWYYNVHIRVAKRIEEKLKEIFV